MVEPKNEISNHFFGVCIYNAGGALRGDGKSADLMPQLQHMRLHASYDNVVRNP